MNRSPIGKKMLPKLISDALFRVGNWASPLPGLSWS
jgi:hypothetical protein